MSNFAELDRLLHYNKSKSNKELDRRKVGRNTYLIRHKTYGEEAITASISVKLHNTEILTYYPSGEIYLNTNGWSTVTTAARMNEWLPGGYRISRRSNRMFLYRSHPEKNIWDNPVATVESTCRIRPDGTVDQLSRSVAATLYDIKEEQLARNRDKYQEKKYAKWLSVFEGTRQLFANVTGYGPRRMWLRKHNLPTYWQDGVEIVDLFLKVNQDFKCNSDLFMPGSRPEREAGFSGGWNFSPNRDDNDWPYRATAAYWMICPIAVQEMIVPSHRYDDRVLAPRLAAPVKELAYKIPAPRLCVNCGATMDDSDAEGVLTCYDCDMASCEVKGDANE